MRWSQVGSHVSKDRTSPLLHSSPPQDAFSSPTWTLSASCPSLCPTELKIIRVIGSRWLQITTIFSQSSNLQPIPGYGALQREWEVRGARSLLRAGWTLCWPAPQSLRPWLPDQSQTCFRVSRGAPGCLLLAGTGRDIWGWLLVTYGCHSVLYQQPALPAGACTPWAIKMQLFFKAKKSQASSGPGECLGLQWFYPVAQ